MHSPKLYFKLLISLALLSGSIQCWSQNSTSVPEEVDTLDVKYKLDSFLTDITSSSSRLFTFSSTPYYMHHSPDKKDHLRYKRHKELITKQPTKKNYELYYSLACSLWELNKIPEAEKMFQTIINSQEDFYTGNYYHSSDVPGDKTKNSYGYGSFTSNYKSYAAKYLSKIYIEQKTFEKALSYLEDAVHKYATEYNCGTGHLMQQMEYDFLYACCYQGLNKNKELVELLLPGFMLYGDSMLTNAIRNLYNQQEIEGSLKSAENSLEFILSTEPYYWYTTKREKGKTIYTDSVKQYAGSATMVLFDKKLSVPVLPSEEGNMMTREKLIADFKASYFYKQLITTDTSTQNP